MEQAPITVRDLKAFLESCPEDAQLIVHHRLINKHPHRIINTKIKLDGIKEQKVIAICLN